MNEQAERVEKQYIALGMKAAQFQEKLGIQSQNWNNWKKRGIPRNYLSPVAAIIKKPIDWIINGDPLLIEGKVIRESLPGYSNVEPYELKTQSRVPVINEVQAGLWCEAVEKYHPGDAENWELCPVNHGPYTFALKVNGNSMTNPTPGEDSFRHGDIVFIDPDRVISSGDYVVAKLLSNHNATFKQYIEDAGRRWLMPLNPRYEKIEFVEGMHICGRLIYHGKRY